MEVRVRVKRIKRMEETRLRKKWAPIHGPLVTDQTRKPQLSTPMKRGRQFFELFLFVSTVAAQKYAPKAFRDPTSDAVDSVNPYVLYLSFCHRNLITLNSLIGNGGDSPNGSGGMIPSTAPPFAMTRWVAQTRQNYVSMTPYNITDTSIHGFQVWALQGHRRTF
jgi:hypothetical protein